MAGGARNRIKKKIKICNKTCFYRVTDLIKINSRFCFVLIRFRPDIAELN